MKTNHSVSLLLIFRQYSLVSTIVVLMLNSVLDDHLVNLDERERSLGGENGFLSVPLPDDVFDRLSVDLGRLDFCEDGLSTF